MNNKMIGHFECNSVEEKSGNKYLVLGDDINKNKEISKKYNEVWEGVKKEIETINGNKRIEYGKDKKKLGLGLMMICH